MDLSPPSNRPVPDPTELTTQALREAITNLEKLQDEKFTAIHRILDRSEDQRKEQKVDSNRELNAAFEAAKQLVAQTNAFFKEQLSQLVATFNEANVGLRRDIDAVKDRVGAVENQKVGAKEDRTGLYASLGVGVTLILAIITIVGFLLARG